MKKYTILFAMVLAAFFGGCQNRNQETTRRGGEISEQPIDPKDALENEKDNLRVEKEEYQTKVQNYLDQMDTRIDNLKKKENSESGGVRVKTARQINRMQKDRDAIQARLDEIKSASALGWKDVRSETDQLMSKYDLVKH